MLRHRLKGVAMRVRSVSRSFAVLALFAVLAVSCGSSPIEPEPVTGAGAPAPATRDSVPTMTKITPSSGPVGTVVTITGSGFLPRGNHLTFGRGYIKNLDSTDGAVVRFEIPDGLDLCSPDAAGPCPGGYPQVMPGDYEITVTSDAGHTTKLTFTVTRP